MQKRLQCMLGGEPGTASKNSSTVGRESGSLDLTRSGSEVAGRNNLITAPVKNRKLGFIAGLLLLCAFAASQVLAATIVVTSLQDKIGGPGGCSLKEAIYAAKLHASLAPVPTDTIGNQILVGTACTAGDGNDIIQLPVGAPLNLSKVVFDGESPFGPATTPLITSTLAIYGNGATLTWTGGGSHARLFSVASSGSLSLQDMTIVGFSVKGGDGTDGGGGGLGAGGAIYVKGSGSLTVQRVTFQGNSAVGGNGAQFNACCTGASGGGGGGLGGNGGHRGPDNGAGGGGGGSLGNGADGQQACCVFSYIDDGGGGGGTAFSAQQDVGGFKCGGLGGWLFAGQQTGSFNGEDGQCPGGGAGGGAWDLLNELQGHGGNGSYGGGGGGGSAAAGGLFDDNGNGGDGGFGGGGGGSHIGSGSPAPNHGGKGGFGGGGGAAGHPGTGGLWGGDAKLNPNSATPWVDGGAGGGGGALGGAIFNDGGAVTIENSTFHGNAVLRGNAGNPIADNGADAGGAIFSLNGSLTILNATVASNGSSGADGGVTFQAMGAGASSASFVMYNSIIAYNGKLECDVLGTPGNLSLNHNVVSDLASNTPCSGPFSSFGSDPLLGPLQMNGGSTPTMSIPTTPNSPAFETADPTTSLAIDQRGIDRPQGPIADIGAYEACLPSHLPIPTCQRIVIAPPPPTYQLTMQVSPPGGGTTNPAVGTYAEVQNSVIPVSATAAVGYAFTGWTVNVSDPTNPSTTVVMSQDEVVTAFFKLAPCGNTLNGRGTASSTYSPARVGLVWTQISGLNHWDVLRGPAPGGPYTKIGSVPATSSSYLDTNGLTDGVTYYYTLNAVDANGNLMCWSNQKGIFVP